MVLILTLLACVREDGRPDVGECAEYPDGAYTYGQIGIGTCLAAPKALRFAGDPSDPSLLVINSNAYLDFTGGSLLSLRWNDLDLSQGRNLVTDLGPTAVDLPSFAADLDIDDQGLGLVPVRYSEDSRTRADDDQLWLMDLTDPANPALSDRGEEGGSTLVVGADPIAAVHDATTGLGFVANRTSHSISVLDLNSDPVEVIEPWPDQALRQSPFFDTDGSGSRAELAGVDVVEDVDLVEDLWTLSWFEGSFRLWLPASGGLENLVSTGLTYEESGYGLELSVEDADGDFSEVLDPAYENESEGGRLYFVDQGAVLSADVGSYLGSWSLNDEIALEGKEGGWDEIVGGPELTYDEQANLWMFYDGTDGESWGIGAATSSDGLTFRRRGAALLEPTWDHERARISDPYVLYDAAASQWRMYYSAYDGETWTIGHAVSYDLETWTSDDTPIFSLADEGVGAAAPAIAVQSGLFRMWYARLEGGIWSMGAAESVDGVTWTDLGEVAELDHNPAHGDDPPGPALLADTTDGFSVSGAVTGPVVTPFTLGETYSTTAFGWTGSVVAGYQLSPLDAGAPGWAGVSLDSVDWDAGLAWLSLTSRDGDQRIGVASIDADGRMTISRDLALEAGDDYDQDGVASPVVISRDGAFIMYYEAIEGLVSTIGVATSDDGLTWTRQGQALEVISEAWDGADLFPGSAQVLDDGSVRLWYTGSNGDLTRIGSALSVDGLSFEREEATEARPWAFPPGSPGDWDDSGVRDPYVVRTDDGDHLFYAGSDGDTWKIGHAFRASEGNDWARAEDPVTEEPRPVLGHTRGLFHTDGTLRPVARWDGETWSVWFTGIDDAVTRVGLAAGTDPERLHERPRRPTLGDSLQLETQRGDEDGVSIPLDTVIDGRSISGIGLTSLAFDQERGMLYVATSHAPYIMAIDARDDSADGAPDANYLDLEGILVYSAVAGGAGFRSLWLDGDRLFGTNSSPESVVAFDVTQVEDNSEFDVLTEAVTGALVADRGSSLDEGVPTTAYFGPGGVALHPDGRRLFVAGFNSNSLMVYDLSLGTLGLQIADIDNVGEMPFAVAFSPDGDYAVVANYAGEVDENRATSSTLAIVDINEQSPTYLEVVSWIVNR